MPNFKSDHCISRCALISFGPADSVDELDAGVVAIVVGAADAMDAIIVFVDENSSSSGITTEAPEEVFKTGGVFASFAGSKARSMGDLAAAVHAGRSRPWLDPWRRPTLQLRNNALRYLCIEITFHNTALAVTATRDRVLRTGAHHCRVEQRFLNFAA